MKKKGLDNDFVYSWGKETDLFETNIINLLFTKFCMKEEENSYTTLNPSTNLLCKQCLILLHELKHTLKKNWNKKLEWS